MIRSHSQPEPTLLPVHGTARGPVHGTRPRALLGMLVGFAALAVMHLLVSKGVLAVNFSTADQQFRIYSNYVQGTYGAGYVARNDGSSSASQTGVTELGFKQARLAGLCAIAQQEVPGIGTVSLIITAGVPVHGAFDDRATLLATDAAGAPIELDGEGRLQGVSLERSVAVADMFLNATSLVGYGNKISGLDLGHNAADVGDRASLEWRRDHGGAQPADGGFGLFSERLNIAALDGGSYGINLAGQVTLPGLRLAAAPGVKTQADCPAYAPGE